MFSAASFRICLLLYVAPDVCNEILGFIIFLFSMKRASSLSVLNANNTVSVCIRLQYDMSVHFKPVFCVCVKSSTMKKPKHTNVLKFICRSILI